MEVQKHPHHVMHKKKWGEYALEFLMLFLAVFLGFIAENIREQVSDRAKEKEYIRSLVEDLQADTATLHQQIPQMQETLKGLDTLLNETYLFLEHKADTRVMYYTYHHDCRQLYGLRLSQRTINQLKNSGNMRLIHDAKAANIISGMETGFALLEDHTRFYLTRQEDAALFGLKIFDFREYQKANAVNGKINTDDAGFLTLNYQPPLNETDPAYLKEFGARVGYFRNAFDIYVNYLIAAIPDIEASIRYLKQAYHLNND